MKLDKLRSIREGHYKVINQQLEKIEIARDKADWIQFNDAVAQKFEIVKSLNEKILEATEVSEIEEEIIRAEEFCLDVEVKLRYLKDCSKNHNSNAEQDAENQDNQENRENKTCEGQSNSYETHIDTVIHSSRSTQQNVSMSYCSSSNSTLYQRLPKLSLPNFSGNILDWQTFWDTYELSVHLNPNMSEVQKFSYLKSQLEGDASRTIKGFALTNANYTKAIDLLKDIFGQPHKIIHAYMQALLSLPAPSNTLYSLRNYFDKLEAYISGLESLGQCQDTYGTLLVLVIIDKLPADIRKHLAREHGSSNWQLEDLRKALYRELNIMEAGQSSEITDEYGTTASFFTGSRHTARTGKIRKHSFTTSVDQQRCIKCNGNHQSNNCTRVVNVKSRTDIIKKKRLCFNCLKTHQVVNCRSNFRCRKCQRKHHTSICDNNCFESRDPIHKSTLNPDAAQFNVVNDTDMAPDATQFNATIMHSTSKSRPGVLLKTAIAQVCSDGNYDQANVLFDEGAQRSFITENIAAKLKLIPTGSTVISLASFGESSQKILHLETATVFLLTHHVDKIPLEVLIVPTIAVPLRNIPKSVTTLPHLRNLKLALPVFSDDLFEISILIGADHYWNIVGDRTIRGNGPTAVSSKIGYLLSGPLSVSITNTPFSFMLNVMSTDIEKFWKLESMGISSEEDKTTDILQTYQQTSITFDDGGYTAKLPWKENHQPLPTNYEVTKKRTQSLIRRLCHEPQILQKYSEIIAEQEKRDFIPKIEETEDTTHQVHYIMYLMCGVFPTML